MSSKKNPKIKSHRMVGNGISPPKLTLIHHICTHCNHTRALESVIIKKCSRCKMWY